MLFHVFVYESEESGFLRRCRWTRVPPLREVSLWLCAMRRLFGFMYVSKLFQYKGAQQITDQGTAIVNPTILMIAISFLVVMTIGGHEENFIWFG